MFFTGGSMPFANSPSGLPTHDAARMRFSESGVVDDVDPCNRRVNVAGLHPIFSAAARIESFRSAIWLLRYRANLSRSNDIAGTTLLPLDKSLSLLHTWRNDQSTTAAASRSAVFARRFTLYASMHCLLYTSDAADDLLCVDLGG